MQGLSPVNVSRINLEIINLNVFSAARMYQESISLNLSWSHVDRFQEYHLNLRGQYKNIDETKFNNMIKINGVVI